jgi:sortase A
MVRLEKGDDFMTEKRRGVNRKNLVQKVLLGLVFVVGLSIFLYPSVSDYINSRRQAAIIQGYLEDIDKLKAEEKARLRQEALAYNEKLLKGTVITDPFAENRPQEVGISYMDMLNIGEVMGYLEIPEIDVYLPIYHGTSDDVLSTGIGHIEQTSLPIGGSGTNTVLTGHRGLPEAKMFRNLDELKTGDVFYLHSLDEVMAYKVFESVIVAPNDIDKLKIIEGMDLVTLVTCDPYMINTNRLLVRAERTDYTPPEEVAEGEPGAISGPETAHEPEKIEEPQGESDTLADEILTWYGAGALVIVLVLMALLAAYIRKKKGRG